MEIPGAYWSLVLRESKSVKGASECIGKAIKRTRQDEIQEEGKVKDGKTVKVNCDSVINTVRLMALKLVLNSKHVLHALPLKHSHVGFRF